MITRRSLFGLVLLPLAPPPAWPMSLDRCSGVVLVALARVRDGGPSWASVEAIRMLEAYETPS